MDNELENMKKYKRKEGLDKLEIIIAPHPTLAKVAEEVSVEKIKTEEVQSLIGQMVVTLRESGGVGIAAPQIDKSLRIFIIESRKDPDDSQSVDIPLRVFINPEIVEASEEMVAGPEGCLSIPEVTAIVPRHKKITIKAYNEKGEEFTLELEDLQARIAQHEGDHLDGILYPERNLEVMKFIIDGLQEHLGYKEQTTNGSNSAS